MTKIFSGVVRRGNQWRDDPEAPSGTRIGGVDVVSALSKLDKRKKVYLELHWDAVTQVVSSGGFILNFSPLYRSDAKEKLTVRLGNEKEPDAVFTEVFNVLGMINSLPGSELTLIIADGEDEVDLADLQKPEGDAYTD